MVVRHSSSVIRHRPPQRTRGEDPDAGPVARAKAGDLAAFDCLVRRYQNPLLSVAYQMLGDLDQAHDAVQEAFIRAFRALDRFRGQSAFSTWLYSILYHQCLDELRRRRRTVSLDQSASEFRTEALDIPDPNGDPAQRAGQAEQQEVIQQALARLPERYRAVLVLAELRGLSYEEIAQVIHRPVGTVKSRLARAREAFRREVEPELEHFQVPRSQKYGERG